jgi:hypothetical protein
VLHRAASLRCLRPNRRQLRIGDFIEEKGPFQTLPRTPDASKRPLRRAVAPALKRALDRRPLPACNRDAFRLGRYSCRQWSHRGLLVQEPRSPDTAPVSGASFCLLAQTLRATASPVQCHLCHQRHALGSHGEANAHDHVLRWQPR